MINFIFIDFFDNFIFYNFLNKYLEKYPLLFVVNFKIHCIEGNFPHSFFTEYNYLQTKQYFFIDRLRVLTILLNNSLPFCLDLNNKYFTEKDINDKYLLMLLLTLNNKNNFIHCNLHLISTILYHSNLDYIYIDNNYFIDINLPIKLLNEEEKIYNFFNINTIFNNNININLQQLNENNIYRLMINDINSLISQLILPEYQFIFYKEFLLYEKKFNITRTLGKSTIYHSSFKLL